jgi:photosystem II stability/assembly factor-like uncharacterized protein
MKSAFSDRKRTTSRKTVLLTIIASFVMLARIVSQAPLSAQAPAQAGIHAEPNATGLQGFDLISADEGWVLIGQRLYWTRTAGRSWNDITPPDVGRFIIRAATFLDARHGWLVLTRSDEYALAQTGDGGATWRVARLSLFEPGDVGALAGAVYVHFIDPQTGWLVVKQATSSNFSVGALFKTTDGGATWTRLAIPIGEPVSFVTGEIGWTAGGAAGDELYRTQDGGQTWQPQTIARPSGQDERRLLYQLPMFEDARAGVLPVVVADGDETRVEFYVTDDGGQSWNLGTSAPVEREIAPGTRVPLAVFDAEHAVMIAPGSERTLSLSTRGKTITVVGRDRMAAGIDALDMATPSVGWARYVAGTCATTARCTVETKLLRTDDGGRTWTVLSLPRRDADSSSMSPEAPGLAQEPGDETDAIRSLGSRTQTFEGQGFDKCEIASLSELQTWVASSPYRAVNLYIGGSARACSNQALTASFVSQLSQQGWKFIPTWVGPQAACYPHPAPRMSYDPAVAYDEGVAEANAAIAVAADLGLTLADELGTIIYYDLENYDTGNAACHAAAQAFMSGWSARLRARGNLAGVYSNGPPLSGFASISNAPDAVWPAHWNYSYYNANATVWDVYGLSNGLWTNHQRIRQYAGGHSETWGGVALTIDCNVIDGIVANVSGDSSAPTSSHSLAGTSGAGGWYLSAVRVTLSASDESGGSGVKRIRYKIDGGSWKTYGGSPFTVSGDGSHTVYYKAQDNAGNWEDENRVSFKIDLRAPSHPTSVDPGCPAANNVWQNTCDDPRFTWSGASDGDGSGVKEYCYYWGELSDGAPVACTSSSGFDPPAVPDPVAVRYLRLFVRDHVGRESQTATLFVLRYDASVPTVTVQINDGASTTNQVSVRLQLAAGDVGSGLADARVSSNCFAWSDWQPYADELLWNLPALNRRTLPVYVQLRDRAGNESAVASDTITLDFFPPMPHSANYRICDHVMGAGGSAGVASSSYSLVSTIGQPWATGADDHSSASFTGRAGFLASITGCLPITYSVTSNYTVTSWVVASGGHLRGSANYRLGDTTGQPAASGGDAPTSANYVLSSGFWAQISGAVPPAPTLPPPAPTPTPTVTPTPSPTPTPQPGNFGVSMNGGEPYTNDPAVMVQVWAPNVTHMRLSSDGGYSDENWRAYQITITWTLSTDGDYVTPRYVYAWFRDVGNGVYGPYSDDIIYDPIPPEGRVSLLNSPETITSTLWLEAWDDNSGVGDMRIGETLSMTLAWQPYTEMIEWVLTGDVVYAQFRDNAGNTSLIYGSDGSVHIPNAKRVYLPIVIRRS